MLGDLELIGSRSAIGVEDPREDAGADQHTGVLLFLGVGDDEVPVRRGCDGSAHVAGPEKALP